MVAKQEIIGGGAAAPCASAYSSAENSVASTSERLCRSFPLRVKLDGVKSFQSNLDKLKAFREQDDVMSGCSGSTCASVASAKVTE
ncbi:hypothetical protein F2Q68_00003488 [Brassica cretica]|uniref:Uncharacterized protein n=1 Tax=Brassica cretica TaxID=69181 RepID=A0A8S9JDU8_BRACR|nr:hypothetical protein F2Q68_00003488 [Brassica cretica]